MGKITAVTFDLWQTLLLDTREQGRARAQVRIDGAIAALGRVGLAYDEDHVREAYRACYRTCHAIREHEKDVSFRQQVEIFIGHIEDGLLGRLSEATVQEVVTAYADSFFVYPPWPHEDADRVLRQVKGRGYAVGLISNTGMTPGATFRTFLKQQGLLQYFDAAVFSDEVLLAKPAVEMFHRTIEAIGATPEETVHVGDHLLNDVLGAKQAGMRTIWIETYEDRRTPVDVTPDITIQALGEVGGALQHLASVTN